MSNCDYYMGMGMILSIMVFTSKLKYASSSPFNRQNDGSAYHVRSDNNKFAAVSKLTDDYLNTTGLLSTAPRLEGMALFRHADGTPYMIG